ncbi:hypothetical protein HD596_009911 [Nonomuraea jabiensis]|uniref:Uncharacterized protein n=1 Tax=Nonomuraea jabiensis TaxID=882448 RepID=A0A7W9GG15_9ACTN|nr:hypothetical protein [Nonomuraea jabiensis]
MEERLPPLAADRDEDAKVRSMVMRGKRPVFKTVA